MKETFLKEAALDGREGLEYLTRGQRWFSCLCHTSVPQPYHCLWLGLKDHTEDLDLEWIPELEEVRL